MNSEAIVYKNDNGYYIVKKHTYTPNDGPLAYFVVYNKSDQLVCAADYNEYGYFSLQLAIDSLKGT